MRKLLYLGDIIRIVTSLPSPGSINCRGKAVKSVLHARIGRLLSNLPSRWVRLIRANYIHEGILKSPWEFRAGETGELLSMDVERWRRRGSFDPTRRSRRYGAVSPFHNGTDKWCCYCYCAVPKWSRLSGARYYYSFLFYWFIIRLIINSTRDVSKWILWLVFQLNVIKLKSLIMWRCVLCLQGQISIFI